MAAFGVAASGTHGTIHVGPAGALALRSALRAAIATITGFVTTAAAPILVGFAALLAPSRLGNGDLYSLSVPLSELTTVSNADLYELAVVGGEIDLPVTLGSKTIGNRVEIVAVATNGMTSSGKVPVRLAHFDSQKNVYATGGTDVQPRHYHLDPTVRTAESVDRFSSDRNGSSNLRRCHPLPQRGADRYIPTTGYVWF